jgi:hypothetical protein
MAQTISPAKLLAELREVAMQIESNKSVDRDRLQFAKVLQAIANRFAEDEKARAWLFEVGATEEALNALYESFSTWGQDLVPQAGTTWKREELNAKVGLLKNMAALGMLEDEQAKELEALEPSLVVRKKGAGSAGTRSPQPPIEGRPAKIRLTDIDNETAFSTQVGNVTTSPGNIRQAIVRHFEKKAGSEVTDSLKKEILAAVNKVVKGTVLSNEFAGVRIEVA